MDGQEMVFQVSDFVAYFNQTINYAYPSIVIEGEIANFKISKNKWVYFDLKDEMSSVKFFGSVFSLSGPVENGMMVRVAGTPSLHNLYGFSINFRSVRPVGEGSLKKASDLLREKLKKEGLFDESRKKYVTPTPQTIGLIASIESAAYHDFIKIINNRWTGLDISVYNVGVQGIMAIEQNISAIEYFNGIDNPPALIVMTRGGGSKDDLAVYDDERLVRAVATSRLPTVVAVGHEIDVSLAELVADLRASTPSNAAEMITPDKQSVIAELKTRRTQLNGILQSSIDRQYRFLNQIKQSINQSIGKELERKKSELSSYRQLLRALDPKAVLKRGYAIVRTEAKVVNSAKSLVNGQEIVIEMSDGSISSTVNKVSVK